MEPRISIIIPVYNVEQYLPECMESIVNQTYHNLQIILVDDGSTDGSGGICDEFASWDSRIHVLHLENGGVSRARNVGIDAATGDYFVFVDSDDYVDTKLCATVMDIFHSHKVDIVSFDCSKVNETGKVVGSTEKIRETILTREDALRELVLGNINNYFCNKVFKRCVFQGIQIPEGYVWEDLAVMFRIFDQADHIYTFPEKLYFYRQRKNSIAASISEKALKDIYTARVTRYQYLETRYPEIAELDFFNVALAARRLYDRSLWKNVDPDTLQKAQAFLQLHKDRIISNKKAYGFRLYFHWPMGYNMLRIIKHKIGTIVKFLVATLHKGN